MTSCRADQSCFLGFFTSLPEIKMIAQTLFIWQKEGKIQYQNPEA